MNNSQPTHIFVVTPLEITSTDGTKIPTVGPVFTIKTNPEDAEGIFFGSGYILNSDVGLFKSTTPEPYFGYIVETFDTTDGSNSTEDDVPDRLSMLIKGTYLGHPTEDLRFGKLQIIRSVLRKGGKRNRYSTRRKTQRKRNTRK